MPCGVDNVMFEVDYPHSDSTWPDSRAVAEELMAGSTPRRCTSWRAATPSRCSTSTSRPRNPSAPEPSARERLAGELGHAREAGLRLFGQPCEGGAYGRLFTLRGRDACRVERAAVRPGGDVRLGAVG